MPIPIFAKTRGQGNPLILIHGFPMHQAVWEDFGNRFTDAHQVITPDLPGFGRSPILPFPFTIDQVADQLLHFIEEKGYTNCTIIGHSLGGYVSLALVAKRPDLFSAMGLFHSTAVADSAEKKESRDKVVAFVTKNGAVSFTANFIAPLFADPDSKHIASVRNIASASSKDAVIGYTLAMRDRSDRTKTLREFNKPTLFLAGDKDMGIPVASILEQAAQCQYPDTQILRDVAHMGMYEKPAESAAIIQGFLGKI